MPKFFYSIILVIVLAWGLLALLVLRGSPDTYPSIFLFITVLFIALGFSLSIPIYLSLKRKNPEFANNNLLYKKGLKYALFIAFGISGIAFLRAFRILSLLNVGLFMLLYLGFFYQLKSKR
jgi:glucan phosphoethanolaminetransferase (alkaline phosphatase superfamily)